MQGQYPIGLAQSITSVCPGSFEIIHRFHLGGIAPSRTSRFQNIILIKKIIDHDITDLMNRRSRLSFPQQVFDRAGLGHKIEITDGVDSKAIDFLWHRTIATAQPRLDMNQWDR